MSGSTRRRSTALLAFSLLHGCTDAVEPAAVASVTIVPAEFSIEAGEARQLTAVPQDAGGATLSGRSISWSSSSTSIASVSATGLVTGVTVGGPVSIRAAIGGVEGVATVTIAPPAVATITIENVPGSAVVVGSAVTLVAVPRDAPGSVLAGRVFTWTSSNEAVAVVGNDGLVTAINPGNTRISAAIGSVVGNCDVSVVQGEGNLQVVVGGLPAGGPVSIHVASKAIGGPRFDLGGSGSIANAPAGFYSISGEPLTVGLQNYHANVLDGAVEVTPGSTTTAYVMYYPDAGPSTGTLEVSSWEGYESVSANLSGPNGFNDVLDGPASLHLLPGRYIFTAPEHISLVTPSAARTANPRQQIVDVLAGQTTTLQPVTYSNNNAVNRLDFDNAQNQALGIVELVRSDGLRFRMSVRGYELINVPAGSYRIRNVPLVEQDDLGMSRGRRVLPAIQEVSVAESGNSSPAVFSSGTGALQIQVSGLPNVQLTTAIPRISGPGGLAEPSSVSFSQGSALFTYALWSGSYEIIGACRVLPSQPCPDVTSLPLSERPYPARTVITLDKTTPAFVPVIWAGASAPVDFSIDNAILVQSIQTTNRSVPLIEGKPGILLISATATVANKIPALARVRMILGGQTIATIVTERAVGGIPLPSSAVRWIWTVRLSGSMIRRGTSLEIDLDHEGEVPETNESNNRWPGSAPLTLAIEAAAVPNVRFIPVLQTANGLRAVIDNSSAQQFVGLTRAMYPFRAMDVDLHPAISFSGPALTGESESAWSVILSEIEALRVAEGSSRHYYGVVKLPHFSGIVGFGLQGGLSAVGTDDAIDAPATVAHELGHNWDRLHAPCGTAIGLDSNFPFANGNIGPDVTYDQRNLRLAFAGTDVMGYCADPWVSAYTYIGVMAFRRSATSMLASRAATRTAFTQRSLLVWGRVHDGRIDLEPAFEITAPAQNPPAAGDLRGRGARGNWSAAFSTPVRADASGRHRRSTRSVRARGAVA